MNNFSIIGVHRKIRFLGFGFLKNQYIGGVAKKGGAWKFCTFKSGLGERGGGALFSEFLDNLLSSNYT